MDKFIFMLKKKYPKDRKQIILETAHPDRPDRVVYEDQLHESVYEENESHDAHPEKSYLKAVFSWIAPEYHQHPKSLTWWVVAGISLLIIMIIEAWTGNWTMLLATMVFGVVYWYLHEHHPPRFTKVVISDLGLKIGHRKIPYSKIHSFWVLYDPPNLKRLVFRLRNSYLSDLIIELEDQDPTAIANYLSKNITELTDQEESIADLIVRLLKM